MSSTLAWALPHSVGFNARIWGPGVSAEQLERVQGSVAIGRDEGAELALGGDRHGDVGFFHQPTVFTGVRNDMRIAREEIFGPVMSVLEFGSEDEAYAIANDTDYGLAAGVWTNDLALAHRASRSLRVGSVWVNTYQMVYPTVPYGGVKLSGHGKALGAASLDDLTQIKSVWRTSSGGWPIRSTSTPTGRSFPRPRCATASAAFLG